jgi:pimeloyl-ACP methyl ester carboxylesterase
MKRITRRERVFYCGHSMGGMLGYGYAGIHDDFEGLITIGSPADLGRGVMLLRLLALGTPALGAAIDLGIAGLNLEQRVRHTGRKWLARGASLLNERVARHLEPGEAPQDHRFHYMPVDAWLKFIEQQLARAEHYPLYNQLTTRINRLSNPDRVSAQDVRWLLREGGEREPRKVVEQFARWVRRGEMVCYRTGFDFKRGFSKIAIPMAIIFGDMDPLASVESTRSVYHAAQSDYLLWRPVKGNSHIELTMGHDIRQICYDIKNLMEYARTHRNRTPSLPRLR